MFDRALNALTCINVLPYGKKRYFKVRQFN